MAIERHSILCPNQKCKKELIAKTHGKTKLYTRIVVFDEHGCTIKCQHCGQEVKVPVMLNSTSKDTQKLVVIDS